jgi:hypothetical protein
MGLSDSPSRLPIIAAIASGLVLAAGCGSASSIAPSSAASSRPAAAPAATSPASSGGVGPMLPLHPSAARVSVVADTAQGIAQQLGCKPNPYGGGSGDASSNQSCTVYYPGYHTKLAYAIVSVFSSTAAAQSYASSWPPGMADEPTWYINIGNGWVVITDSLTRWVAEYFQERLGGTTLTNPS